MAPIASLRAARLPRRDRIRSFYTPPTSVPSSPNNRPTLTATSVTDTTKSDTDAFTITTAVAITVTINQVNSVLAGTAGTNFDAAVQNDSSDSGVTWTLTVLPRRTAVAHRHHHHVSHIYPAGNGSLPQ